MPSTKKTRAQKAKKGSAAKNYLTRSQAVNRLQVSLADFRRLCIFKGIFPREPKKVRKALRGSSRPTTFYHVKDVQYLMHEPVLNKFRDQKVFARKLQRALGRNEISEAKRIDDNRPRYKLDHIIKERYPTFVDALSDLDDPLSMLFLFALLPATDKISAKVTEDAQRLCNQWMVYVSRERLLRKVFVSIKGVYYQAVIKGQEILWLVPFNFPQNIPSDVDFRIMLTFLELYTTLLHFVLYRLYTEAGLVYPPPIDPAKLKGVGGLSTYVLESTKTAEVAPLISPPSSNASSEVKQVKVDAALKADAMDGAEGEQEESEPEVEEEELDAFEAIPATETIASDVLAQPKKVLADDKPLFSSLVFFVGREVPLSIMEFLITSFGGRFIAESALDELVDNENENQDNSLTEDKLKQIDLSSVTHQITDRPAISKKVPGRVYIQPQWIFDSINKNSLLPVADYAPGEALPPHLSPWGDSNYDPEAEVEEVEGDEDSEEDEVEVAEGDEDQEEEEEEEEDEEQLELQKELEKEAAGVPFSEANQDAKKNKKKKRNAVDREQEEKNLRKIMMTNKNKVKYDRIQAAVDRNKSKEEVLKAKKRKIEKSKRK